MIKNFKVKKFIKKSHETTKNIFGNEPFVDS